MGLWEKAAAAWQKDRILVFGDSEEEVAGLTKSFPLMQVIPICLESLVGLIISVKHSIQN